MQKAPPVNQASGGLCQTSLKSAHPGHYSSVSIVFKQRNEDSFVAVKHNGPYIQTVLPPRVSFPMCDGGASLASSLLTVWSKFEGRKRRRMWKCFLKDL